jgi:hypothetical protein
VLIIILRAVARRWLERVPGPGWGGIEPRMVPYEAVLMASLKADRSCRDATFSTRHPIRSSTASYSGIQYEALAGKGRERISVTIKRYGQGPPGCAREGLLHDE